MRYDGYDTKAIDIITDERLTINQQFIELYKIGENSCNDLDVDERYLEAISEGTICDLAEGKAPFRPRYIAPDYAKFMKNGSKFLELKAPTNLLEATTYLMILYENAPTGSTYPAYLGNLDTLLEPFIEDEDEAYRIIKMFLLMIDRMLPNSFVHANIGPYDTRAGRIILRCTEEMNLAVPNITLKYDPEKTSDEFACECIKCMLKTSKPSFANDKMFTSDLGDYAIASCYNGFAIGGGAYTMNRLKLSALGKKAKSIDDFFDNVLPYYSNLMIDHMRKRIIFIHDTSAYFKSNFLVKEGLLEDNKFVGLFGLAGLCECVNNLLHIEDKALGYGHNEEANKLGERIIQAIVKITEENKVPYSSYSDGKTMLHAQVGIDSDGTDCSPGVRIAVGYEPEIIEQMMHSTRYQKYFPTGVGDIYKFDQTYAKTPSAILDLIKGGMANGMRYFSGYEDGGDVVRVTGYLVKRSELEKLDQGKQSMNSATLLGQGARNNGHALDRKLNSLK